MSCSSGPDLIEGLTSASWQTFERTLEEAQASGAGGEEALIRALGLVRKSRLTDVITAIGNASGPLGPKALRSMLQGMTAPYDIVTSAMVALARRCGPRQRRISRIS